MNTQQQEEKHQQFGLPSIGIPAEVLFNPNLSLIEKVLYGFIKNLAYSKDGCFATNAFLGGLVGVKQRTVTKAIKNLKDQECIVVKNKHNSLTGSYIRKIYMSHKYKETFWKSIQSSENARQEVLECYPGSVGVLPPLHEDATNITNNTTNNISNKEDDNTNVLSFDSPTENQLSNQNLKHFAEEENVQSAKKENVPASKKEEFPVENPGDSPAEKPLKKPPRKKQSNQSDPVEKIIDYWNSLEKTVSHKKPETKTYKLAEKYLSRLLEGKPILHTKDGNPTKPLLNFLVKHAIDEKYLWQKWTVREIKYFLKLIHDEMFRSDTKYNLPSTLWNGFAQKTHGFSYFLYKVSEVEIDDDYLSMARKLSGIIDPYISQARLTDWAKTFQHFVSQNGHTKSQVMQAVKWYNVHGDEKFVPAVSDADEFVEKFAKIERAMKRNEEQEYADLKNDPLFQSTIQNLKNHS